MIYPEYWAPAVVARAVFWRFIKWLTLGKQLFWNRVGGQSSRPEDGIPVPPRVGMALVHDHRLLHESPKLRVGVKHVIRTDVMYERV